MTKVYFSNSEVVGLFKSYRDGVQVLKTLLCSREDFGSLKYNKQPHSVAYSSPLSIANCLIEFVVGECASQVEVC
jgi:hypothetical protein